VRTLASAKGGVLRGLVAARGCHARRKNNGGTDGFSIQAEREKEREQVRLGARRGEGGVLGERVRGSRGRHPPNANGGEGALSAMRSGGRRWRNDARMMWEQGQALAGGGRERRARGPAWKGRKWAGPKKNSKKII
jgi:hypothetical protein